MRYRTIAVILRNYKVLSTALTIIQEGHNEYTVNGSGLLYCMEQFNSFFGLKLAHQIFTLAEQCSINLQAVNITVQGAC